MGARLEFCGEIHEIDPDRPFTIGREADLSVDDNQFLHRRFLQISHSGDLWWLTNVGGQLAATLSDTDGRVQAWLAPGAHLPLVFRDVRIWFTAGPTTYELTLSTDKAPFEPVPVEESELGTTTVGRATLTPEQRMLLLGLAEPMLRRGVRGAASVPSSADVAARLGWSITKFNRKLDNVCQKLEKLGVPGLHGGPDRLAGNRRSRLVEYALAARLVRPEDLSLLDVVGESDQA